MPDVAVIGNGPAGLIAAWAAKQAGANCYIYSGSGPSTQVGAQYLHRHLPQITQEADKSEVQFIKLGTAGGYAEKVYGNKFAPTSWARFKEGRHPAWSMQDAYMRLWDELQPAMRKQNIKLTDIGPMLGAFDLVVNTAPLDTLCLKPGPHDFESQTIWVTDGQELNLPNPGYNAIVYNGDDRGSWYRMSWLFGRQWAEYTQQPGHGMMLHKPLRHTCSCYAGLENWLSVGRFGAWDKDQLASDAYEKVFRALL